MTELFLQKRKEIIKKQDSLKKVYRKIEGEKIYYHKRMICFY
jgi:hypothetical protein